MPDAIDKLCDDYKFSKMLKEKKDSIVSMVRLAFRTYEVFYGEGASPPGNIIRKIIRIIIEVSPEAIHLGLSTRDDIYDKVVERVVEKIYKIAENELLRRKEINYVA